MDERLRKRILAFYIAGVVNLLLGIYVLIEGPSFLARDTVLMLGLFFVGFAAVDFYFPRAMKKKWLEDEARRAAMQKRGK